MPPVLPKSPDMGVVAVAAATCLCARCERRNSAFWTAFPSVKVVSHFLQGKKKKKSSIWAEAVHGPLVRQCCLRWKQSDDRLSAGNKTFFSLVVVQLHITCFVQQTVQFPSSECTVKCQRHLGVWHGNET